jgi:ABC-type transport system involved in multi-copper enzyme maturation permease subunit
MYTLTIANSRTKILLAKAVTVVVYSLAMLVGAVILAVLAYWLGMMFAPTTRVLIAPELFWSEVWQAAFFVVGYGLLGLLFAFLFRHLVGAIAALFIIPTIEALLGILLKNNSKFLPMTSLEQVHSHSLLSSGTAALVFVGYMVVAWLVAWYVFLRRDAN